MKYNSFAGNVLRVDLTTGDVKKEPLDVTAASQFIGGAGYSFRLAWDVLKPGTDALAPENPIVISPGVLVGTMVPGAARIVTVTKFPLTNAVAGACGSMSLGSRLKWAGYDHVVITGRAPHPVYLKIVDDDVQLRDARDLWGKDIYSTTETLWGLYGRQSGVLAIGEAGERLVRFALALVDRAGTMGHGGLGAVFGSKNLKAIVADGTKGVNVAHPKRLMEAIDGLFKRAKSYPELPNVHKFGIMANWENYTKTNFPYRNSREYHPDPNKITELFGPAVYEKVVKSHLSCPGCFTADKDVVELSDGPFAGLVTYCSSWLDAGQLGMRFDVHDYGQATHLCHLLQIHGICKLTFISFVDFVIDLYDQGLLTSADTGGLELRRDYQTINTLIDLITRRDGFGDLLAGGWEAVIQKAGPAARKDAVQVKGIDTMFDPRTGGLGTMELEEVVNPRGGHWSSGGSPSYLPNVPMETFKRHADRMGASADAVGRIFDSPFGFDVGRLTRYSEDWYALFNSLGVCNRHHMNRFHSAKLAAEIYSAATGLERSVPQLMQAAERVWNVFKMLNVREGFDRKDDAFPERWFEPMRVGDRVQVAHDYGNTTTLTREHMETFLDHYYEERGWDVAKGIPTPAKLSQLGLGDLAG